MDGFDRLVGVMLSEDGNNIFFIITAPGYDYLYAEILDWTIEHWLPRYGTLKTEVHEYQEAALATLEQCGFLSLGVIATTRAYDLRARGEEAIGLPTGFRVVDMGENGDYRAKALVNKSGFEGQDQVSELELLKFAYSRENPAYDPALDLSVVTAEGLHVASCVGFNDAAQGVAEVEKVCTHNQYRRQGLAEAVIRACFQRLRARGTGRAYITGYSAAANALYEKLGPCAHKRWFHYELK
jgi:ribosomal protein S18 acetylase RimI-like enzyme